MWLFSPSRMALENAKYFSSSKHAARSAPSCHRPYFSAFSPVRRMNGVKGGRVSQGSRVNLLPTWLSPRGQKQMQKCFLCAKVTLTDDQIRLVRLNWGAAINPLILRLFVVQYFTRCGCHKTRDGVFGALVFRSNLRRTAHVTCWQLVRKTQRVLDTEGYKKELCFRCDQIASRSVGSFLKVQRLQLNAHSFRNRRNALFFN